MKKTTSAQTPSPRKKVDRSSPRREFLIAATNMSWQLAIVVLVPILGGFELDQKLDTLPAFTIIGFFLAMGGMALVVWRQLQLFSPPPQNHKESHS